MKMTNIFIVATLSSFVAGAAVAQTSLNTSTGGGSSSQFDDLQDDISDDAERVLISNVGRDTGFNGSVALRGTSTSGNTDTVEVGIGANLGYYDGVNGYSFTLVNTYSEANNQSNENSVVYGLEYARDFNDRLFGYAQLTGSNDEFADITNDTFFGFGLGYRIIDTNERQWSVSAGPGYRSTNASLRDFDEPAFSVSSNFAARLTDTVAITNDTDIISSDENTVVYNDFAMSVAMSNSLALRTSLLTEYNSDVAPGFDDTDNSLGMSIVYNFN